MSSTRAKPAKAYGYVEIAKRSRDIGAIAAYSASWHCAGVRGGGQATWPFSTSSWNDGNAAAAGAAALAASYAPRSSATMPSHAAAQWRWNRLTSTAMLVHRGWNSRTM